MRASAAEDRRLRALEAAVADIVRDAPEVFLAYSGGLASTVLASVVRKRTDLACIVAGAAGSPDVRAALVAKDYLDLRVEAVTLDREAALRTARAIRVRHPRLSQGQSHSLVPVWAAREAARGTLLCGFGRTGIPAAVVRGLRASDVLLPLLRLRPPPGRLELRSFAEALGLPPSFARARHQSPARGAGIDRLLRENPRRIRLAAGGSDE